MADPSLITVLGATMCADTAIVTSRLQALRVPFRDVDIDRDPEMAQRVIRLNRGNRVTPTVIAGDDAMMLAEPTLEALDELLVRAGYDVRAPQVTAYHGDITTRSIPIRRLDVVGGGSFSIEMLRGRRQVALLFGHGADCLACFGYARQCARQREAFAEADGVLLVVVADLAAASGWRHGIDPAVTILADPDDTWKRTVAASIGAADAGVLLLLLDRFGAPRAVSVAAEAGGLVDPAEAVEWLRFLALECPECSGELPWPSTAPEHG